MDINILHKLLQDLYEQKILPSDVAESLSTLPYQNLGFAKIDQYRSIRTGLPEVIYGEGKTENQLTSIIKSLWDSGNDVLATKIKEQVYKNIKDSLPTDSIYNIPSQTLVIIKHKTIKKLGLINIVSAGTSDIPIAEEARVTAELFGSKVEMVNDVGVAGIHRLLDKINSIRKARVVIVVAGMEGALASVVGGLVKSPVIAVPTSIGYGASFGGVSALLTMLNSCSTGIATVNIDNGFGAGCIAHKINLLGEKSNN